MSTIMQYGHIRKIFMFLCGLFGHRYEKWWLGDTVPFWRCSRCSREVWKEFPKSCDLTSGEIGTWAGFKFYEIEETKENKL